MVFRRQTDHLMYEIFHLSQQQLSTNTEKHVLHNRYCISNVQKHKCQWKALTNKAK